MTCILSVGCTGNSPGKKNTPETSIVYPTVSYLDIQLDAGGKLPSNSYILEFQKGKKKIVFCGTNHLTDVTDINNPMFTAIEEKFFSFKPDICVNEGGDISEKKYASRQEALLQDNEIGLTKILADSLRLESVNGDMPEELEFKELLKKYSTGEFIAYIVNERFIWGLKEQHITDQKEVEKRYNKFIRDYIIHKAKVQLRDSEQSFVFFKTNFEKLLQRPFDINRPEPTNPFDPHSKFQAIGRASKEIRDQFLLQTIDSLVDQYDKVFIVFGGWHLLTCRPGLEKIINSQPE